VTQTEVRDINQMFTSSDIEEVTGYMNILRGIGLVPSDVVRRGIDYSELYVQKLYNNQPQLLQMRISAILCERAAMNAGVHAAQKRTAAEVKAAAAEKAK
jgi:hypothetical protein